MGWGGSKKCKPIPASPRGAGLKSHPIPAPSPLRGGENPHGAKRGGTGQAGRGKIAIPNLDKYVGILFVLFRGSLFCLGGDTMMYLYMFLVSHCLLIYIYELFMIYVFILYFILDCI